MQPIQFTGGWRVAHPLRGWFSQGWGFFGPRTSLQESRLRSYERAELTTIAPCTLTSPTPRSVSLMPSPAPATPCHWTHRLEFNAQHNLAAPIAWPLAPVLFSAIKWETISSLNYSLGTPFPAWPRSEQIYWKAQRQALLKLPVWH